MMPFDLERAQAYQHLGRWTAEFKDYYDSAQYVGDWFLATQLLVAKDGDAKFASPQELMAAEVLNCIVQIEATVETGEAYELHNGVPLLETIKSELRVYVDQLTRLTSSNTVKASNPAIETASRTQLTRRAQQHQQILNEIAALDFDPMAIPDGGKSAIKKICQADLCLFAHTAFDHAWKSGLKLGLFKMENRDKFAGK